MDDGELDFSSSELMQDFDSTTALDSMLDELLKSTQTCTHTHTCNPPGPDKTHTHTCYHTHTQLLASGNDTAEDINPSETQVEAAAAPVNKKKRPSGNREAVRKYREKKKAHTVFLEEQVAQLKSLNQQLVKRLQRQATLEAEVVRLRSLLSEFRNRVDVELGLNNKSVAATAAAVSAADITTADDDPQMIKLGGFILNSVNVPCDADVPCLHTQQRQTPSLDQFSKRWHTACDLVSEDCHDMNASSSNMLSQSNSKA